MGGHAQVPGCGEPERGQRSLEFLVSAMSLKPDKLSARHVVRALTCKGLYPSKGADLIIDEAAPTGPLLWPVSLSGKICGQGWVAPPQAYSSCCWTRPPVTAFLTAARGSKHGVCLNAHMQTVTNGKTSREGARLQGLDPSKGADLRIGEAAPNGRLLWPASLSGKICGEVGVAPPQTYSSCCWTRSAVAARLSHF